MGKNEMLGENIENITKSNKHFALIFVDCHVLSDLNFNGHWLIKIIFISLKKL